MTCTLNLDDVWDSIREWDLPDNYNIDVFQSVKDLKDFIYECGIEDQHIPPNLKYPITVYSDCNGVMDCLKDRRNVDEQHEYMADWLTDKAKEFLWKAHFHDYKDAEIKKYTYPKFGRGHWRKIKGKGKNREGEHGTVKGYTFVKPHQKGKGVLIHKTRILQ